jgi:hypothetical protein
VLNPDTESACGGTPETSSRNLQHVVRNAQLGAYLLLNKTQKTKHETFDGFGVARIHPD